MKRILLMCCISITQLHAQQLEWAVDEHYQRVDKFREMLYVNSAAQPYLVSYMEHVSPPGGGGGGNPTVSHFMYAYDTAGTELWSYKSWLAPIALLSKENDKFWIVTYGIDSVKVRNSHVYSSFPHSTHGSIFFIEVNRNGQVLNHFAWEYSRDISWYVEDVIFDRNGDFLLTGKLQPDQLQDESLYFANTNIILPGDKAVSYLAKGSSVGTQMGMVTMESKRNGTPVILQHLAQNSLTGEIMLAGRSKDSLKIGNNLVYSTHQYRELMLLEFDEQLQYQGGRTYPSSSFGSIPKDIQFNELNQRFYVTGTLGDQLTLLNSDVPVQGHQNSAGNSYVAEFEELNLQQGTYLILQDNSSYLRGVLIPKILFDADTNIRLVANVVDQSFRSGDSVVTLDPNGPNSTDYEMVFLTLNHRDLNLQHWSSTAGHGQAYSSASYYDTASKSLYAVGHYNGHFNYGKLNLNSVAGEPDALILKLREGDTSGNSVGIHENKLSARLEVFPNPAGNHITIQCSSPVVKAELLSLNGSLIKQLSVNKGYSLADVKPSIYILRVQTSEQVILEKLIIE